MWLVRWQDDEINNQSQLVEKLREQVVELEELIVSQRKESESLQIEQQRVQAENDSTKDEVWPVLMLLTDYLRSSWKCEFSHGLRCLRVKCSSLLWIKLSLACYIYVAEIGLLSRLR